jgi:hypothetical protein
MDKDRKPYPVGETNPNWQQGHPPLAKPLPLPPPEEPWDPQ